MEWSWYLLIFLLLSFTVACILSARVCEPEGLDLLFSVNQYRNYVSSLDECYMVPSKILLLSDLCCFLTLVLLFEVTLMLLNRKK